MITLELFFSSQKAADSDIARLCRLVSGNKAKGFFLPGGGNHRTFWATRNWTDSVPRIPPDIRDAVLGLFKLIPGPAQLIGEIKVHGDPVTPDFEPEELEHEANRYLLVTMTCQRRQSSVMRKSLILSITNPQCFGTGLFWLQEYLPRIMDYRHPVTLWQRDVPKAASMTVQSHDEVDDELRELALEALGRGFSVEDINSLASDLGGFLAGKKKIIKTIRTWLHDAPFGRVPEFSEAAD